MRDNFLENFSLFMVRTAKFFLKLAIFCVVIYFIGIRLFSFGHSLFYEYSIDTEDTKRQVEFSINSGDTLEDIANNLLSVGLIDDKIAFMFRAKVYKTKFTINTYNLDTSMTIKNILDIFDSPTNEDIVTTIANESVYQLSPEVDETDVESQESEE